MWLYGHKVACTTTFKSGGGRRSPLLAESYLLSQRKLCQGTTQKNTLYISLARTRSHINWSMSTLDQSLAKGSGMSMTGLIRIIPRHTHTHTLGRALRLLEQRISFPLPPTWTIWPGGGGSGGRPVSSQEENNYLLCAQNQCQSQYLNSHWWMTLKSHQNWSSYHKAYIMSLSMLKTAEYPYCAYDSGESSDLRLESEKWITYSLCGQISLLFWASVFSLVENEWVGFASSLLLPKPSGFQGFLKSGQTSIFNHIFYLFNPIRSLTSFHLVPSLFQNTPCYSFSYSTDIHWVTRSSRHRMRAILWEMEQQQFGGTWGTGRHTRRPILPTSRLLHERK